ncbi:MarR family transcriptional regulator [Helcobacillus massiliensis]|uniref:DNA-binding MarR family transcriptional regulator n=1 Tax=Helcobacillus massiliensis TaxID=521392 RepID=A0A839QRS6_9MICO|nr:MULTISPECIES: MarR family transcriptional regulator [Helcobacillus]MBB3023004.1 DNA-binding MarR family transcriptional regulator [Helcobacillus massiliensis]MCG7427975.1 MarR family transcriptional regulator [Helcobacillus sp. ACRRO]MCT1558359.1 MarR family transcriptional regulator [Helcobacillus massiliensis]MCT2036585.1 MarR family transcriptional regulator [Helcobacillus massiliensis]MCT2332312.1 MarR family transcriptional regulator [Helcobacillus massiliensis]
MAPTNGNEPRWLSPEEQRAWRVFLYTTTRLREALSQALEQDPEVSLTLAEYEILVRLSEAPGGHARMSELADHVVHSRSRLTHTVTRLEKRGLVERQRCASDGRGREALLTADGRALLERAAPVHVASVRAQLVDPLGTDGMVRLGSLLSALLTEDERAEIAATPE